IGTKDPTYLAAALHGQHRLSADEAKKLAATVGVPVETAMATTAIPLRTDFPLTTDPFKYRLMELVGVYGDALRERCNELFGDGGRNGTGIGLLARAVADAVPGIVEHLCAANNPRVHREALALLERPLLAHVLALTGGNQLRAARMLGLNRNTLRKRCRELSL